MADILNFQIQAMRNNIKDNIEEVRKRISVAAGKCGRQGSEIILVAVSKRQSIEKIKQAAGAGIDIFAENQVQELISKVAALDKVAHWHLVGHLQTNKVSRIIDRVEMIQSVDSIHLLDKLSVVGESRRIISRILLQVNTSAEASKFGFHPAEVESACAAVERLENIQVEGLMTIGPLTDDAGRIAVSFGLLRKIFEKLATIKSEKIRMRYLSMGMSSDFDIAIQEGSNLVRIGTAIFGPRQ
jgi:pyridoxal phosphate enzyme (YggS family)